MKLFLKIWRQKDNKSKGAIVNYEIDNISPDMSFLEMMDVLNEEIISSGGDPVAFDHMKLTCGNQLIRSMRFTINKHRA